MLFILNGQALKDPNQQYVGSTPVCQYVIVVIPPGLPIACHSSHSTRVADCVSHVPRYMGYGVHPSRDLTKQSILDNCISARRTQIVTKRSASKSEINLITFDG